MVRYGESTFQSWAKPPSQTEQIKCDNTEGAVTKAIRASGSLKNRSITVFPQGSYRNRTNVRLDSDVDICVCCTESVFFQLPDGMTAQDFGIHTPATYSYSTYKNEVGQALTSYFGSSAVTRGNKAFDVHENTYRVDADVVVCFKYRWYRRDGTYLEGTAFIPDQGTRIVNWPDQNYDNGVAKNTATARRFKAIVRILKRLRNDMEENNVLAAISIPSYLIECLVWNVPNEAFGHNSYREDVRSTLAHLWNNTRNLENYKEWGEINELKYLFRSSQNWTCDQAHKFLDAAWNHIGFE